MIVPLAIDLVDEEQSLSWLWISISEPVLRSDRFAQPESATVAIIERDTAVKYFLFNSFPYFLMVDTGRGLVF